MRPGPTPASGLKWVAKNGGNPPPLPQPMSTLAEAFWGYSPLEVCLSKLLLLRGARRTTGPLLLTPADFPSPVLLLVAPTARRMIAAVLRSTTFEQDLRRLRRAPERARAIICDSENIAVVQLCAPRVG